MPIQNRFRERIRTHAREAGSVSRIEVLLLGSAVLVLASLGCASLRVSDRTALRSQCLHHLKTVGVGFQLWLHDHEDRFPWQVPVAQGGSFGRSVVSDHFLRLSNYSVAPAAVSCPGLRRHRPAAETWATLSDLNVSYALNCDAGVVMNPLANSGGGGSASAVSPGATLVMDMDLEGGRAHRCPLCQGEMMTFPMDASASLRWSKTNHVQAGNVLLIDGTVQTVSSSFFSRPVASSGESLRTLEVHLPR